MRIGCVCHLALLPAYPPVSPGRQIGAVANASGVGGGAIYIPLFSTGLGFGRFNPPSACTQYQPRMARNNPRPAAYSTPAGPNPAHGWQSHALLAPARGTILTRAHQHIINYMRMLM